MSRPDPAHPASISGRDAPTAAAAGLEIEIKLKVVSHQPVRDALAAAGAAPASSVLERNHIFDSSDGSLRAGGRGLRVRECRDADGSVSATTLTFKGPRRPGPLKTRPEITVSADSASALCDLLAALGFVRILFFEKQRETWRLGDVEIALDTLPHLGTFVEIEGPHQQAIRRTQDRLGLGSHPPVTGTYPALVADWCRRNRAPLELRFESGDE